MRQKLCHQADGGKRLAALGAHVDDSVAFQVYNNLREDAASIAAVNETKGQVVLQKTKWQKPIFILLLQEFLPGLRRYGLQKRQKLSYAVRVVRR